MNILDPEVFYKKTENKKKELKKELNKILNDKTYLFTSDKILNIALQLKDIEAITEFYINIKNKEV